MAVNQIKLSEIYSEEYLKNNIKEDKKEEIKKAESTSTTIGLSDYNPSTTIGNNPYLVKAFKQEEQVDYSKIKQELDSKLEKGMIDNDLHTKAIDQLNSLVKAKGEGSRGGHVIGHTKSGKPVYATGEKTKDYSAQDHLDAAELHKKKAFIHTEAKRHPMIYNEDSGSLYSTHDKLENHHNKKALEHKQEAAKQIQEEQKNNLSSDEKKILADQKKKQIEEHEDAHEYHKDSAERLKKIDVSKKGITHRTLHNDAIMNHEAQAEHHKSEAERLKKDY